MTLDKGHCELTGAELDLVGGAKKIKELQEEVKEAGSKDDHKGFGAASALFGA